MKVSYLLLGMFVYIFQLKLDVQNKKTPPPEEALSKQWIQVFIEHML